LENRDTDVIATPKVTLKYSYDEKTRQVYGPDGVVTPAVPEDDGEIALNTSGVRTVWGENGLTEEPSESSVIGDYETPSGSSSVSLFKKLSIKKSNTDNESQRKEKIQASIFRGVKKTAKTPEGALPPAVTDLPADVSGPYGIQPKLKESDYQLLDEISAEIMSPLPAAIQTFSQSGDVSPVYQDSQCRCSALARDGVILLAVMNVSESVPMMDFSIKINGPDVLQCEVLSHPARLIAIPMGAAIWYQATFRFPQQMRGFPDFQFSCEVKYNKNVVTFDLPFTLALFFAPVGLTTPQFGSIWKQGGSEIVHTLARDKHLTLDEISKFLNEELHMKTVQRIGTEEIFVANLVSTPFKVLIHVKFLSEKVDVKVLTKAQPLTLAVVGLLKNVLK
jgi:AP-4 complex subunit epsilon-1